MSKVVDESNGVGSGRSGRSEAQVSNSLKLASQDTEEEKQWAAALNARDCNRLMALLHQHPCLWLKTDPGGRTVLHVAVMQGCVELVKLVLLGLPLANGNQQEFQENLKKLLDAKDGKCRADAFQLSAIVGNQEVIQVLNSARPPENGSSRSIPCGTDSSDASRHIDMKSTYLDSSFEVEIIDILKELPRAARELHESLQKQMKEDVDYNFEEQRKGLIFNFACKKAHSNIVFLKRVASKAKEKPILWQKLFTQMDAKGRTPLHVAVDFYEGAKIEGIQELLDMMPDECVNGHDGAGRTPLMRATANGMNMEASEVVKVLADDERTELNAEWSSPEYKRTSLTGASGVTALHLAVLHNHGPAARSVLEAHRDDITKRADVEKRMTRRIKVFERLSYLKWTPLELAAVMGRHSVLVNILQACKEPLKATRDQRCLHLAAAAGDPRSIQALLLNRSNNLQNFETNHNFGGYSCLHFAVSAFRPHQRSPWGKSARVKAIDEEFDRFLAFEDFASTYWLQQELTTAAKQKDHQKLGMPVPGYGGKKTCTTLLLQAGVDIWPSGNFLTTASGPVANDFVRPKRGTLFNFGQKKNGSGGAEGHSEEEHEEDSTHVGQDFHLSMPDPGSEASDDARIWWFELVAKETLDAKNNFNAAGNATAVVATLVATASFMGPLSPPLGYGSDDSSSWTLDRVQMASLPVRVFMASNSISFYLGIASIMLAIMPSLPMPQEGLREELRRSQRTVALAISVLLLSILGLLVSFTSCLIAVMPQHHYWSHTFGPPFVGGIICIVVIFLFFVRVLRLVFNRNARIKNFYHSYGFL